MDGVPLLIETSPPIANLLMRAEDGIDRRDWKLAIDSLQRVIDDRSGTLVPRDDGADESGLLFESARRRALRRLASLPAEGLLAYRVLYDGKARGLFDRARAASDMAGMQAVADRFLLTRLGDDAAEWVASRALDEGRFAEAASRLNDILTFTPDNDLPPERIYGKLFAAYSMMGLQSEADAAIDSLNKRGELDPAVLDRVKLLGESLGPGWVRQVDDQVAKAELSRDDLPRGFGPKLTPTLSGPVPWLYELTGTAADLWRRIADFHPGDPAPVPLVELAGANQQIFVRIPGGCIALDMEDLSLMWQAVSAALPRPSQIQDPRRGNLQNQTVRPSGPYAEDPTNRISTAMGMVYAIDRHGMGEFLGKDEVQSGGMMFLRPAVRASRTVSGTRLTALDAQTGDVRWRRGRTDDSADVLGNVLFLSTPIAVDEWLWVSYMRGSDILVGALRAEDGALMKQALIGSIRDAQQPRELVTLPEMVAPMTLSEGVVYLPTGVGAMAALDVAGLKPRWTYVYDRNSGSRRRPGAAGRWIAGPPQVESGIVLVAVPEYEELIGLDATTGEFRWSALFEGCTYTITAHGGKAWLGGRRIVCLNMADGREVWSTDLSETPTGKAALCGDQIQAPVANGLITLDAYSGAFVGLQELPTSQAPLGNIACLGASLYSLEPSSVRKFADLKLLHEQARGEIEAHPDAVSPRIRLAWAEMLEGRHREALAAVRDLSPEQAGSVRQRMSLARIKIESLLAVAQETYSPEDSLKLLESANSENLTPQLRLRFRMAIANQLGALNRQEEAYQALMDLGLGTDAGELGPARDGVRVVTRFEIKSRIDRLRELLDSPTRARYDSEARSLIEVLSATADSNSPEAAKLAALAYLFEGTSIAQSALIALGDLQIKDRIYEKAEQTLRECARSTADPALAFDAISRLAAMYLESDQSAAGLVALAEQQLSALLDAEKSAGGPADSKSQTDTRKLIAKLQALLSDPRQKAGLATVYAEPGTEPATMALSGRIAWTYEPPPEGEPTRVVLFDELMPRAAADRVIMLGRDGFLECLSLERKETLWRARMGLPGTFEETSESSTRSQSVARYGIMDGQTIMLTGPDGIFAVGALTGRLLWAQGFDRAVLDLTGSAARDRLMATRDGYVVAAPRDGFLSMMLVSDGSRLWERDLRGESMARVWLEPEAVVFADADMKRVHLLDRLDGHLIARLQLRQPDPDHERVTLVMSNGLLYGPDRTASVEGVGAYELSTGTQKWRVDLEKPIVSLFEPKPGYLGVGLLGGDVKILRAESGEVLLERSDPSVRAVTSGTMWAGTLILRSTALRGPRQTIELAAFDIATGVEVWRRKDVSVLGSDSSRLEVVSGVIPALLEKSRTDDNTKQAGTRLSAFATLIDVRTGADAGTPTEITGSGQGYSLNGDMVLWPGILAVGSMKGVQAMRVELTALPERGF